jgi:hypothetical protein
VARHVNAGATRLRQPILSCQVQVPIHPLKDQGSHLRQFLVAAIKKFDPAVIGLDPKESSAADFVKNSRRLSGIKQPGSHA